MKSATHAIGMLSSLLVGLMASAVVQAEQVLNAHYEVNVTDGGSTNSVRSTFRTTPGGSERLELHPNVLQMTVQPVSEEEYDLRLVVKPKKHAEAAARIEQTFRGTFGVPLELKANAGGLEVDGAISVAVLEDDKV